MRSAADLRSTTHSGCDGAEFRICKSCGPNLAIGDGGHGVGFDMTSLIQYSHYEILLVRGRSVPSIIVDRVSWQET
jgi:hypothetical protein